MSMIDEALTKLMDDEISAAEYVAVVKRSVREQAVNERGVRHKHFTDAELAAESYRQMARAVAVSGAVSLPDNEFMPADVAGGPLTEETQRLGVIKRFATTPHYFEEAA